MVRSQNGELSIPKGKAAMKKIQQERVRQLNEKDVKDGDYVLYWMQEAQRAEYNYALEYAVQRANEIGQRLLVLFGLTADYPEANLRHYAFMLEGLRDVEGALQRRGIRFVVQPGSPDEVALEFSTRASMMVCDMGYMRPQKGWREKVASEADCLVTRDRELEVRVRMGIHTGPVWSPTGRELFYLDDNQNMMLVPVRSGSAFEREARTIASLSDPP